MPQCRYITMLENSVFSFGIYFSWLFVRSFDSGFVFLSFSFVMNFIFMSGFMKTVLKY